MCYDRGKNVIEKVKIVLKLQVEHKREGNRATSVSEQNSLAAECTGLAAIV